MKNSIFALFATRENFKFLFWGIAFLLFLLILVMLLPPDLYIFKYLTGEKTKLELIKLIGWGMSGIIAFFGVVGILQRAAVLDKRYETAEKDSIQRAETIEKRHIQDRFKAVTEHLGNEQDSVRIAAFYEFYHLVEIEPNLQSTIFDILCTHLRKITKNKDYKNNLKPTEEVQGLLDILFKPKNEDILIFKDLEANLAEIHLQGADLRYANLQNAKMQGINLQDANLQYANLQGTHLQRQYMKEEDLQGVDMQEANLQGADLLGAQINRETTVIPDNWKSVVKLYDNGDGKKRPFVVVMNNKGEIEGRY